MSNLNIQNQVVAAFAAMISTAVIVIAAVGPAASNAASTLI